MNLVDCRPERELMLEEVISGLMQPRKRIAAKFFYDERGSMLFSAITRLPEYYLTRTEETILRNHSSEILSRIGPSPVIIEPGSGSSVKIRLLLDHLTGRATYVPIDISREQLERSAQQIRSDYPDVSVVPLCADYTGDFALPPVGGEGRRMIFFPGSTIGNFEPDEIPSFLERLTRLLRRNDAVLIGVDTKKEPAVLHNAYNDADGVTAAFNLNVLAHINDTLGATFDLAAFEHAAFYNEPLGRIEMHLVSRSEQRVTIGGHVIRLHEGETIHTENSYKYDRDEFVALAAKAQLRPIDVWMDPARMFMIHLLEVAR